MMKKAGLRFLCVLSMIGLVGCQTQPEASSSQPESEVSSASSQAVLPASSQVVSSASSAPDVIPDASSVAPMIDTSTWPQQFISLPIVGTEKKALIILRTPPAWQFDNKQTFLTEQGLKIAEVVALYPIASAENPFPAEATQAYESTEFEYPEGYGLVGVSGQTIGAYQIRTYLYKVWPEDFDTAWYPHYSLIATSEHVLVLHFYSFEESNQNDIFNAVASSLDVFISEDTSSSVSVPTEEVPPSA